MRINKKPYGFSLIEVLAASALVGVVGVAIDQLQLAILNNSQQAIIRQLVVEYANDFIGQISTQLNYVGDSNEALTNPYLEVGAFGSRQNNYVQTSFSGATSIPKNCATSFCEDAQFSLYLLNSFKQKLAKRIQIPDDNIKAIICRDDTLEYPTMDNPHCDNKSGSHLTLKVVWKSNHDEREVKFLTRDANYVVLRIPGRR